MQELDCAIVQIPGEQNGYLAVVLATVRTSRGLFRAVGEASRDRLPTEEREHTLTVAEIRAKTRALGDAVGQPCFMSAADLPPGDSARSAVEGRLRAEAERARADAGGTVPAAPRTVASRNPATARAPAQVSGAHDEAEITPLQEAAERPRSAVADAVSTPQGVPPKAEADRAPRGAASGEAVVEQAAPPTRPPTRPNAIPVESIGPEMVSKLLQMTRRKASLEGSPATEEEALRRLDSYFLRAFGHDVSEASRMEGQRVVQRLAADLARMNAESGVRAGG
jgi:hypothetical protein